MDDTERFMHAVREQIARQRQAEEWHRHQRACLGLWYNDFPAHHVTVACAADKLDWPDKAAAGTLYRSVRDAAGLWIIYGPTGRGKTQLATGVAKAIATGSDLERKLPAATGFTSFERYASAHAVSLKSFTPNALADFDRNHARFLLVVDEMPNPTGMVQFQQDAIDHLVNVRYEGEKGKPENKRPLILITNASRDDLCGLNKRVLDRIMERGGLLDVTKWPNKREANK